MRVLRCGLMPDFTIYLPRQKIPGVLPEYGVTRGLK
jgi:hypothetical protein